MSIYLTILFVCLAAAFKAIADTLQHHYSTSIFKNLNERWWNPNVSWMYVKLDPVFKYRADAWHIANTFMIFCFCIAAAPKWWWFFALGVVFNISFNIFYNKILR